MLSLQSRQRDADFLDDLGFRTRSTNGVPQSEAHPDGEQQKTGDLDMIFPDDKR